MKICILLGANEKEVIKQAEDIIQFETRLAQVSVLIANWRILLNYDTLFC